MEVQPFFCFVPSFVPFSRPSQHAAVLARGNAGKMVKKTGTAMCEHWAPEAIVI